MGKDGAIGHQARLIIGVEVALAVGKQLFYPGHLIHVFTEVGMEVDIRKFL